MKFKVFGLNVPVYKQKDLTKNTNWCGYFDPDKKRVIIDYDLSGDEYEITLIHEFIEAVWFRNSFELAVNNETKEIIIDQISKALVENFKLKVR